MTTIAYRDGLMVADTRAYAGDRLFLGHKNKLQRLPDGTLSGVSTVQVGLGEELQKWIAAGHDPAKLPANRVEDGFFILMVKPDRTAFFANSSAYFSGPLEAEFWAIGSGENYAMGALAAGATALQAVEIAARFDQWTEGPFTTLEH